MNINLKCDSLEISLGFDSIEELKKIIATAVGPLSEKALTICSQAQGEKPAAKAAPATKAALEPEEEKPAAKKAPATKAAAQPTLENIPDPEEEEKQPEPVAEKKKAAEHTETDFKLLASQKVKENKTSQIKDFFAKWGGKKISEVLEKHPDEWEEIYAEMEAL